MLRMCSSIDARTRVGLLNARMDAASGTKSLKN
jgi:hypothetical protein